MNGLILQGLIVSVLQLSQQCIRFPETRQFHKSDPSCGIAVIDLGLVKCFVLISDSTRYCGFVGRRGQLARHALSFEWNEEKG